MDGVTQVGKITKNYSGLIKEAFTNADNFSISCMAIINKFKIIIEIYLI